MATDLIRCYWYLLLIWYKYPIWLILVSLFPCIVLNLCHLVSCQDKLMWRVFIINLKLHPCTERLYIYVFHKIQWGYFAITLLLPMIDSKLLYINQAFCFQILKNGYLYKQSIFFTDLGLVFIYYRWQIKKVLWYFFPFIHKACIEYSLI